jgi:Spy/CpxP family protein refolding chaperone
MARTPRAPGSLPIWYEPLNLTVDQRAKIEAILAKRSARVDSAMKSACVVIAPARDSSTKEADAVLTPDQRAKRDSIRGARQVPSRMGGATRGMFGCGPVSEAAAAKR